MFCLLQSFITPALLSLSPYLVDFVAQTSSNYLPPPQQFTDSIWSLTFPEISNWALAAGGVLVVGLFLRKV